MKNIKRIISMLVICSMILASFSICTNAAETVRLYAPDGRSIKVWDYEVPAYVSVGWYEAETVRLYAPDGRSIKVWNYEVPTYVSVGWYEAVTMYDITGTRTITISPFEVDAYEAVNWYYGVPTTLYDSYGYSIVVGANRVNQYLEKGYSTQMPVKLQMSEQDIANANAVNWIHQRKVSYYEIESLHRLFFGFMDKNEKEIYAPAIVDIKIVNDNNETVYNATKVVTYKNFSTWTWKQTGVSHYLASVEIPTADITPGSSESGKLYFTVKNSGYFSFDEKVLGIYNLPKISYSSMSSVQLPAIPQVLHDYGYDKAIDCSYIITNVRYEFEDTYNNKVTLKLYFDGEKYYDQNGPGQSSTCRVSWKLYDMDGYVVDDGTFYSPSLLMGEKFRNECETISYIEPGQYRLEILSTNER